MSCHDIGRGMNEVVKTTITLYDKGEISKEAAKKLLATCGSAVWWCDGNPDEAIDYIRKCRCGKCLKMVPKEEKLYSTWEFPYESYQERIRVQNELHLVSEGLCESCFDEVMAKYCDDIKAVKRWYVEKNPEGCSSEGEHPDHNNGCEWPDRWYEQEIL